MNLLVGFCFLSVVPLLLRGWNFPVGGSTPDRLGPDRLRPLGNIGIHPPAAFVFCVHSQAPSASANVGSSASNGKSPKADKRFAAVAKA